MQLFKKEILSLLMVSLITTASGCNDLNGSRVSSMTLTIMHMNDSHSYADGSSDEELTINGTATYFEMGGYPRLTTKVNEIRSSVRNSLLLHAGDAVQGTLYFTRYEGKSDFEFLNAMGVDAMSIGNHEFDKGPEYLKRFIGYADFPVISANINATAEPSLAGVIKPYLVKEFDGERVGVIGLTTTTTEFSSTPGDNVIFNDITTTVDSYVSELESEGVNKIILLTHLGYDQDLELAKSVEGVDIIVGGHSHTLLGGEDLESLGKSPGGPYPTAVRNGEGDSIYVVQSWQHTLALGRLDVEFDDKGSVTAIKGSPILLLGENSIRQKNENGDKVDVDEATRASIVAAVEKNGAAAIVAEDSVASAKLAVYTDGIKEMETHVIAYVSSDLYHTRIPFTDIYGTGVQLPYGSYIAPVVCESMLWKMGQVGMKVDFALQNGGGVRRTVSEGNLTVGEVYQLLPFGNTLSLLELTGKEFQEALQEAIDAAIKGNSSGAYPYVAGCRYTVDAQTDPDTPTVTLVEKQDASGAWRAISGEQTYRIVANSYIAEGGDYYSILGESTGYRLDTGFVDAEVFMEYAIAMGTLKRGDSTGIIYYNLAPASRGSY